jgi:hypothetical protein
MDMSRSRAIRGSLVAVGGSLVLWILAGCARPHLEVTGPIPRPDTTVSDAGILLTVLPNTWAGYPSDLPRYYTPLEVRIQNDRAEEIQVRYLDFMALDELNNQYRAVAPPEVARALFGRLERDKASPVAGPWTPSAPVRMVASQGIWWRSWWYRPWYPFAYPYPYSPYSDYYSPYAWPRGTGYDILRFGLREGRVLPGARVEGFLYFQLATEKGNTLAVSWAPVRPDGTPLATLRTELRIVR